MKLLLLLLLNQSIILDITPVRPGPPKGSQGGIFVDCWCDFYRPNVLPVTQHPTVTQYQSNEDIEFNSERIIESGLHLPKLLQQ